MGARVWRITMSAYLAVTDRSQSDILVVKGWIGRKGIHAAVDEFERGGYRFIIASGGLTSGRWEDQSVSYASMAAQEMMQLGIPKERISLSILGVGSQKVDDWRDGWLQARFSVRSGAC